VIELTALNALPPPQFVEALAGIFEHSAWIPERAAARRPFESRLDLLDAMRRTVLEATPAEQLALISAHPKLGARGRPRQQLTPASSAEQRRAGLDACSDEEFARLQQINASYLARFGFPFILAVRGHDPPSIIAQLTRRLEHDRSEEIRTAIHQIGLIASYRLADAIASPPHQEVRAMLDRLAGADPASLLREWMLAAGLAVREVDAAPIGTLPGTPASGPSGGSLILGIHCNANTGSLSYDGRLGCTCAIAVLQLLKGKGSSLEHQLAEGQAMMEVLARAQLLRGSVAVVPEGGAEPETALTLGRATGALQEFLLHTDCHG
jgi:OHCU decarboxylase